RCPSRDCRPEMRPAAVAKATGPPAEGARRPADNRAMTTHASPAAASPSDAPADVVRAARPDDVAAIVGLIHELAEYEKLAHLAFATPELLLPQLFGPRPGCECLVAEQGGRVVGFALFFHNFSTFLCKPGLYLEDLYVQPAARGTGLGKRLLIELARI